MKVIHNSKLEVFNNEEFSKILKFDCSVVDLETIYGGGYFTVLPVSSNSKVDVQKSTTHTTFRITDDWGKVNIMTIPNFMDQEIKVAEECAQQINKAHRQ